jgi:hypothetical protein
MTSAQADKVPPREDPVSAPPDPSGEHSVRFLKLSPSAQDSLVLAFIVLLSVSLYVTHLGFYSDDWAFLGAMTTSGHHSLAGLIDAQLNSISGLQMRPLQTGYQAVLFSLFGVHPLGYHIVNALVLTAMTVLLYLVLHEIGLPRPVAVAVPAMFAFVPSYSTNRFWFAAFGYTLTLALYFLSLYADLRAVRSRTRTLLPWTLLALLALVASGLGYEIVLPFLLVNTVLVWIRARALWPGGLAGRLGRLGAAAYVMPHLLLLAAVTAFKVATATGAGVEGSYLFHLARLTLGSLTTHFGTYGIGLPQAAWWGIRNTSVAGILLAAVLGLLLFTYTMRSVGRRGESLPEAAFWLKLGAAGALVFALGYAVFLVSGRFDFSSSGIYNRVNMAAALGAAMLFVALAGWLASQARGTGRRLVFSSATAALCVMGFLVLSGLASFWTSAWPREQAILTEIRSHVSALPSHSTLILQGTCPYIGPAIVFDSPWDLAGALQVLYRDSTLEADVATTRLTVHAEGIRTTIYGPRHGAFYPFNGRLVLFDTTQGLLLPLTDAQMTGEYLVKHPAHCPPGQPGTGVVVFPLDKVFARWEAKGFRP